MSEFNDAYRKGEDYGLGRGVATDFALAADYFRIAADGGHIEAMCDLAELLIMDGSEVQNIPEGEKWLRKAVSAGSSAANCTLAKFLISRGSPFDGEPRTLLEAAVKSGNREAMFELASGLEWLVKDCEFSDTDAKEKAGRLMTLANDLLKRAAENGHAGARARLADFTHATNALLAEYGLFGKGLFHVMNSQEAYEGEDPSDDEGALNSTIPVDDFADQGDAETQLNLGYKYFEGLEVKKDLAQAVAWFRKAAEQGQMIAQFNLGCCYRYGDGVALDLLQAAAWFHKAADQGYAMAQHNLGTMYHDGEGVAKNDEQAIAWFSKEAENGNADLQCDLGYSFLRGTPWPRDVKTAAKWFRKAAEQGLAVAQLELGVLYDNGIGVERSVTEAFAWYRKAADQGELIAQCNLGYMLERGWRENGEIVKDIAEAALWYRKSADQDYSRAQRRLGSLYEKGLGVVQDDAEAFAWYLKAEDNGEADANSRFFIGRMYETGLVVEQDDAEAAKWYSRAIDLEHRNASLRLEAIYAEGRAERPTKDVNAEASFRKAADQGDAEAQFELGKMYFEGTRITKDCVKAVAWLRKAAEQGNADAKVMLWDIRLNSRLDFDPECDFEEEVKWLREAAGGGNLQAQFELAMFLVTDLARLKSTAEESTVIVEREELSSDLVSNFLVSKRQLPFLLQQQSLAGGAKEGWNLLCKVIEQGHEEATNLLMGDVDLQSFLFYDEAEIYRAVQRGAEQGCSIAQNLLQYCYTEGNGLNLKSGHEKCNVRAFMWAIVCEYCSQFSQFDDCLHEEAEWAVDNEFEHIPPEQKAEGRRLAQQWLSEFKLRKGLDDDENDDADDDEDEEDF